MATKTYSVNTGSASMATYDSAIAANWGYEPIITDPQNEGQTISNPETASQFGRKKIVQILNDLYRDGLVVLGTKSIKEGIITGITPLI